MKNRIKPKDEAEEGNFEVGHKWLQERVEPALEEPKALLENEHEDVDPALVKIAREIFTRNRKAVARQYW